jgi:hypothetical protein
VQDRSATVGRYELREELGAGGFATVYRAYDPTLDRAIALKLLHLHLARDAATRERFVREGRALARVRHPNIVQVYDAGEAAGTAYLAMELIEGRPLGEVLGRRGPASLTEVVEVVDQVAGALAAVHARNLVHRDVKPANILVENATGRAVLLDLGVARDLAGATLSGGWIVGTPGFMAPEQLETHGQITHQTDVYQLGATVYTLLAGRPPFQGDTVQVINAVAHGVPTPLTNLRPDLPPGVAMVVVAAMAKDPTRRPRDMREFAAQLRAAAGLQSTIPLTPPPAGADGTWAAPTVDTTAGGAQLDTVPASQGGGPPAGRIPTPPPIAGAGGAPPTPPLPQPGPGGAGGWPTPPPPRQAVPTAVSPPLPTRRGGVLPIMAIGVLAGVVIAAGVLFARMATGGNGEEEVRDRTPTAATAVATATIDATVTRTATATATPLSAPVVLNLKVFDNVFSKREGEFEVTDGVDACFDLKPGGNLQPLTIVVTPDTAILPTSVNDPNVVGRSDPIEQRTIGNCYHVKLSKLPFPPGRYVVSVLHGTNRLTVARFVAKPKATDILFSDDFNDRTRARLSTVSDEPSRYRFAYDGGEYVIQKLDPNYRLQPTTYVPGSFDNATIVVDVRLTGETDNRYVAVGCRFSDRGHYRLLVEPAQGRFVLVRFDGSTEVNLVGPQVSDAINRGTASNRLELSCAGNVISAAINGTLVATREDTTYRTGRLWFAASTYSGTNLTVEGRFDNLQVIRQ